MPDNQNGFQPASSPDFTPGFPNGAAPGHISLARVPYIHIVPRIGFGSIRSVVNSDGTTEHVYHDPVRGIAKVTKK